MSTPPTRTGSATSAGRRGRRRPTEFRLPDGRKILVALPEEVEALRSKYASANADPDSGPQIEVVVHGSAEHQEVLRQAQRLHAARHEELRRRYGADFDEWARTAQELDSVTAQLERLADRSAQLHANFGKFGFSAQLRTYGDDEEGSGGRSRHGSAMGPDSTSLYGGDGGDEGDGQDGDGESGGPVDCGEKGRAEPMKLFRRPVVKQYFHRGLLWRASEQTEVMCFELFFDLLYGKLCCCVCPFSYERRCMAGC